MPPTLSSKGPLRTDARQVASRPHGSHICHFYRGAEEALALVKPFLLEGLSRGERALWAVPPWLGAAAARGALGELGAKILVLEGCEAAALDWLAEDKTALALGFTGLRVCRDGSAVACSDGWTDLLARERVLDASLSESKIVALCAYDALSVPAERLVQALGGHQCGLYRDGGAWQEIGHGIGAEGAVLRLKR